MDSLALSNVNSVAIGERFRYCDQNSANIRIFLMLSSVVIFFTYKMQCEYKHLSQYIPLALAATVEPLFYHPLIVLFSLRGYFEYIIGKKAVWKTIARKGYDSTDKSKQS